MRRAVALAAGVAVLHVVTAAQFPWQDGTWHEWLKPSPDLVLLLGVAVTLALARPGGRALPHLLALGCLAVPAWRAGWSAVPRFFDKPFEPYDDVLLLEAIPHLLLHDLAPALQVAAVAGTIAALAALYLLTWAAARAVLRAAAAPGAGLALLAACQAVTAARWCEASLAAPQGDSAWLQPSMAADALHRAGTLVTRRGWRVEQAFAERAATARAELARVPNDLALLARTDVYLVFVESYGRGLLRSRLGPELERRLHAETDALRKAGIACCSGFVRPSVAGGQSSLAHAELLSGVPVDSRRMFDRLLASDLVPLPHWFLRAGHHTVNVQPAMPRAWPEGAKFFGFAQDVFRDALPYDGRVYGWGDMPDQFALAHALRAVIRPARQPLFVQYVSVSSHAPFAAVPPYFEDWDAALAPRAFAREPAQAFSIDWGNYVRHPQLVDACYATLDYSLRVIGGFARQLPRPSLLLVLGDHQPPSAGEFAGRDVSYDVPLHVLAHDAALLAPFERLGFVPGMAPVEAQQALPSARLLYRMLAGYGRGR
jgi:hypothetical protein